MRFLSLSLLSIAAASAFPVAPPAPTDSIVAKRDLFDDIPGIQFETIDIPAWLEQNRLTLEGRVDTMLQRNQLSRRSSALGLLSALGFKPRSYFSIMQYLEVRINADINHLFKERGTWCDQNLRQMFEALKIDVNTIN